MTCPEYTGVDVRNCLARARSVVAAVAADAAQGVWTCAAGRPSEPATVRGTCGLLQKRTAGGSDADHFGADHQATRSTEVKIRLPM